MKNFLCNLFLFRGRLSRGLYIIACLFVYPFLFVQISHALGEVRGEIVLTSNSQAQFLLMLDTIAIWMLFSVTVTRYHDLNKTGLFALLHIIPIAHLIMILYSFSRGYDFDNKYGPGPLGENKKKENEI